MDDATQTSAPPLVEDAQGRSLEVRKLSLMERLKINELLPDEWLGRAYNTVVAFASAAVRTIDGVPALMPHDTASLRALIEKLGDDGYEAARDHIEKMDAATAAARKARIKN